MQVKTSEMNERQLDWVVAKILGHEHIKFRGVLIDPKTADAQGAYPTKWLPATNWAQGGPIIERERIDIQAKINSGSDYDEWLATVGIGPKQRRRYGPTPLIAAMRCYVASKLGETIEIPEELR